MLTAKTINNFNDYTSHYNQTMIKLSNLTSA